MLMKMEMIKFVLDGCDICFTGEAPADINTPEELAEAQKFLF